MNAVDKKKPRIGGVMISVLASSSVDRRFESRSGQTIDYKIGICCSSLKQQSAGRHVTSFGYIILIPSRPVFGFTPEFCVRSGEAANTNFIVYGLIPLFTVTKKECYNILYL
jgi:hypothetical protein